VRALGGWGKHIQICLCFAQSIFFELLMSTDEATDFRATTKRGYGSASIAVRAEKRANKNVIVRLLFSETETVKQNQKFPFHFLSAPPRPPPRKIRKVRKIFGFCPRESASVSEAHWFASPRNRSGQCSFKPPRAPRVRS